MPLVVGVSFKKVGKVYYFDPNGLELREGDYVIASTARGVEFGEVMCEPKEVPEDELVAQLKKIVRKANGEDFEREEFNRQREKDAFNLCQEKILHHDLPMKLIDVEYCFDGSQIVFFFSADARVDFRELVKDLASAFKTKVQLHQVGVRDEAKLFGGLGPCGRPLCCASFLAGFEPVSMKMAKEQSLFLNPIKFSGVCGKLMCCLKYEYPTYREAKSRLPKINSIVGTPQGPGRVVDLNIIKESIAVEHEGGAVTHYAAADLEFTAPGRTQPVEHPVDEDEALDDIADDDAEPTDNVPHHGQCCQGAGDGCPMRATMREAPQQPAADAQKPEPQEPTPPRPDARADGNGAPRRNNRRRGRR